MGISSRGRKTVYICESCGLRYSGAFCAECGTSSALSPIIAQSPLRYRVTGGSVADKLREQIDVGGLTLTSLSFTGTGTRSSDCCCFDLVYSGGRFLFGASCFVGERRVMFFGVPVGSSVPRDLAEMIRAAGGLSSPDKSGNPPASPFVREYRAWDYRVVWSDGTQTDGGRATKEIVKYLTALAEEIFKRQTTDGTEPQGI